VLQVCLRTGAEAARGSADTRVDAVAAHLPRTQHQRARCRAGEYSAERLKELKKNTLRYAAPRPSEPAAAGVFKLSGSFKPAGAPAVAAAAVAAVLPVGTPV